MFILNTNYISYC